VNTYVKTFALELLLLASFSQVLCAEEANANGVNEKDAWPTAAASQNVTEDDYLGEVPKVLTVSRLSQSKADSPSAVTVIDRETIRASGIVDIPELLRLVPGFYVAKNAGFIYNSNDTVSYHGMASAYTGAMQVLINGRSVYTPLFGGVLWSELPITVDDIERIEITRGPNAASYGANSFLGVISIITKDATEAKGSSVRLTHGTGRNEAFYRYVGDIQDVNFRVSTGYREDDGLDNRNDFKRTNILTVQADKHLDASNEIGFEFGVTNGDRADGEYNNRERLLLPRTRGISSDYELIRWRHNVSDDSDFLLQAYHAYHGAEDEATSINLRPIFPANPPLLASTISVNNAIDLDRYEIEAQHTFSPATNWRVVWGGSVRLDRTYAPYWLGTNETDDFNLQRLFGHAEWRINDQVLMNLGSMIENNDFTGTEVSPRASLNLKFTPNHALRFGISTATRTPNYIEEKFNDAVLIPTTSSVRTYLFKRYADKGNLDPEKIVSKEIGYLGQVANFDIDARIFNDDISHILISERVNVTTPTGTILVGTLPNNYINGGDAEVRGFETQLKYRASKQTQIIANYSFVKINGNQATLPHDFTSSMPTNTFCLLFTHQFDSNWDASYAYYQTSAVNALGDGQPVGLNRRQDIRVARKFNLNHAKGEVSIAVENLLDHHYHEFALYNTLGRRALINLELNF